MPDTVRRSWLPIGCRMAGIRNATWMPREGHDTDSKPSDPTAFLANPDRLFPEVRNLSRTPHRRFPGMRRSGGARLAWLVARKVDERRKGRCPGPERPTKLETDCARERCRDRLGSPEGPRSATGLLLAFGLPRRHRVAPRPPRDACHAVPVIRDVRSDLCVGARSGTASASEKPDRCSARCTGFGGKASADDELALVISRWGELPAAVRETTLALTRLSLSEAG